MSSQPDPTDLSALADALRGLSPRAPGLDREALMFRAGRASARRGWLWPGVSAALLLVCAGLVGQLSLRPQMVIEGRIVRIPAATPQPSIAAPEPVGQPVVEEPVPAWSEQPAGEDYLRLRQRVVDEGVEALPHGPTWSAAPPLSLEDSLLEERGSLLRRHELFSGGAS